MTSVSSSYAIKNTPLSKALKNAQSGFASGERDTNGVIQIRMNNITTEGRLDWSNFLRIPASANQLKKYQLNPGDVLFNHTNSPNLVGKAAVFTGHPEPVVFSNHFIRLQVDETKLIPNFLGYWLTRQWQKGIFENLCTQWVNQATVRREDLLSLEIPLPLPEEQQRIAAILERADHLRRLRRFAREMSDTYLQSVFLEMFGDEEKYPKASLSQVLESVQSGFASGERYEAGIIQIRMNNITTQGSLDLSNLTRIPVDKQELQKYYLRPGDVLFNSTNSPDLVGKSAVFPCYKEPVVFSNHFLRLRVKPDKMDPWYLLQWIVHQWNLRTFESLCTQWVNQAAVRKEDLLSLKITLPPFSLQQHFSEIVQRFERLRARQAEAERQAEHLFQTLLNRAFTGEL